MSLRILLTGGTGFIGKHVYDQLLKTPYSVHCISRQPSSKSGWYKADMLDYSSTKNLLENICPDVLIHLAWDIKHGHFWQAPINYEYAEASKKLFDLFLRNGGKKIISSGTCAEYTTSDRAVSEQVDDFIGLTPYGRSKKSVYNYLKDKQQSISFEFSWLRIFGIFGEGENANKFFPKVCQSLQQKQPFIIKDPHFFTDHVYVKDIAKFIVGCIEQEGVGCVNMGYGKSFSNLAIYNILKNYFANREIRLFDDNQNPNKNSRIPDCTKLKQYNFKNNFESALQQAFKGGKLLNGKR